MAGGVTGRPAPAGRRSALLVANAAYRDPGLSRLRSPVPDIRALADVLGAPAIGAFEVDTLTDADEAVLRRRVAAFFADRGPDDVLLLHFSCHGLKDQRGRLYLAAADTELSALAATGLPASFVSEQLSESASRSVLLVLDCCYSGAFAHDTAVRADRSVHIADAFRGGGTGRVVLTASSATEYSFEGGRITSYEAQPSVFTEALVRGLRTGAADLDHDGEISVDELFEYASQRVREARVGQVPRKWAYESTGPLVVARSVRPAVLADEIRSDLASDRRVLRLEAVRALAALPSARTGRSGSKTYTTVNAGTAHLYDLATRKERGLLTDPIRGDLVFSPDGKFIAAVDKNGLPAVFDAATGQGLMELAGPSGSYTDLAFRPDGPQLIATGTDRTVRRWHLGR